MNINIFIQMANVEWHKPDDRKSKWADTISVIASLVSILASLLVIVCR